MNVEVTYHLTSVSSNCSTCFRRIEASVLMDLLDSHSDEAFNERYVLVDCRYPYEFNGGHIKHAINFHDRAAVNRLFFNENKTPKHQKIPIFYCEFSQKRGPKMADALRVVDRSTNTYPHCSFAEMYVLDKGYRNFFCETRGCEKILCIPNTYIEMLHKDFLEELKMFQYHKKSKPGSKAVYKSHSAPENLASLRNDGQPPTTPTRSGKIVNPLRMLNLESPDTPPSRGLIKLKTQRNMLGDRFSEDAESLTESEVGGEPREEEEDENTATETLQFDHSLASSEDLKSSKKRERLALIENGRPL